MSRKTLFGAILIFLGTFFLLRSLDIIWFSFKDFLEAVGPIALIVIGGWLIVRKKQRQAEMATFIYVDTGKQKGQTDSASTSSGFADAFASEENVSDSSRTDSSGKHKYSKFLGDTRIDFTGQELQNVEISSFVGDIEIRLSGAKLRKGLNRLVISGFLGDLRVIAPRDMPLFMHCSSFGGDIRMLGRHSSGFGNSVDAQSEGYDQAESKLYISCSQFIGDAQLEII